MPLRVTTSLEDRPLQQRMRPDLQLIAQRVDTEPVWVVKDPVTSQYYELHQAEFELLQLLDGQRSFEQIRRRYEELFPPLRLSARQLQVFLSHLHRLGLTIVDSQGQSRGLADRLEKRRVGEFLGWLTVPLTMRFPGIPARGLLDLLLPLCLWLLNPLGVICSLLFVATVMSLLGARFPEFAQQLPRFQSVFQNHQWLYLLLAMTIARIAHELGHALVCRRFGAEVRELGLMLLIGMPTLYCDVSDAWTLSRRWQRVSIALAGVWVELMLAAVAAVVWWVTYPGFWQSLAASLILVCSISTLLINGNPLMRYDAYYVLCDALGISNLAEQSRQELGRQWRHWILGVPPAPALTGPSSPRGILLTYGLLSIVYQLLLTGLIVYILLQAAKPWHGAGFVWLMVGTGVIVAGTRMGVTLVQEARRELAARQTTPVRAVFGLLMLAAVCWFVLGVPWPRYVRGPVTLQPAELVPVFVPIAGRILKKAEIDQEVHPGDLLAQLENPELRSEIETLRSRVVAQKLAVEALQKRRNEDPAAAAELPTAQQLAEELESQLQSREENAARLKIVSPQTGRLFPALRQPSVPPEEETLPLWEDHPLASMNEASWLGEGTLLCWVGREERWLANLFISQAEIERVRIDQPVDLLLSQSRGETLHGKVIRIAESHVSPPAPGEPAPHPLPESLTSFADASGQRKLSDTVFQVTVELTDRPKLPYRFRSRGQARILTGQASLGERLWQEWQRTVKFRL